MKIIKSLAVLIVMLAIGLAVYQYVYKTEEARKQHELDARRLIRFDLDAIKAFTIVRPDSSIVFERGIGRIWNITQPVVTEADKEQIFTLFNSLDQSDILFEVENNPDDYGEFGLSAPKYSLAMEYDEISPDTLFIGNDTPDGTMAYVRFASEDRVLAVTKQLTDMFHRSVLMFRSRTLLNVVTSDISGVEIVVSEKDGGQRRVSLVQENYAWRMTEPWNHSADDGNINQLLDKIATNQKITLIDEHPADLAAYGLDNPRIALNLTLKNGQPNKMLLIGSQITEPHRTHLSYAKQFNNDLVFLTERSFIDMLSRRPEWFINKSPMVFNQDIPDRIELKTAQRPVTFRKDNAGNWSVISPVDKNVTKETINQLFAISRFVLINTLFADEPTEQNMVISGIDSPAAMITYFLGEQEVASIKFGHTFIENTPRTYFKTSFSPCIYISNDDINERINNVLNEVFGG